LKFRASAEKTVKKILGYFFAAPYTGWAQKSKPLPNDPKIVLKRIEACQCE